MTEAPRDPSIELAERVATVATEMGIPTALIGATALAAHNYVRGTADIDLATAVDPFRELRRLQERLVSEGLDADLSLPDAEDGLGGVLRIRATADADDLVEVVNFLNPMNLSKNPGSEAVRTAVSVGASTPLRCATLPLLIALKLYAGGRRDQADVIELMRRNPDADVAAIREVCARYGFSELLEELLREV
ncbi:MAG TPA: hypothetical protein VMG12_08175 [Polyangiaceae bacterium]|nr:hypothetical protein [Polyangiaceae bacterium]